MSGLDRNCMPEGAFVHLLLKTGTKAKPLRVVPGTSISAPTSPLSHVFRPSFAPNATHMPPLTLMLLLLSHVLPLTSDLQF